jgi:hypothetical protein
MDLTTFFLSAQGLCLSNFNKVACSLHLTLEAMRSIMRHSILCLTLALSLCAQAQPQEAINPIIDAVVFEYDFTDERMEYSYPQLSGLNSIYVDRRLNADIKKELYARGLITDTASLIRKIHEDYAHTIEEHVIYIDSLFNDNELSDNGMLYYVGSSYEVIYQSQEIISIAFQLASEPPMTHGSYWGFILHYDLRTGYQLKFEDLFYIDHPSLLALVYESGYEYWIDYDGLAHFDTLRQPDDGLERSIGDLMEMDVEPHMRGKTLDDNCVSFRLDSVKGELHLRFVYHCLGPMDIQCGLPFRYLNDYVIHYTLLNELDLWGESIYDLIGRRFSSLGNKMAFESQTVRSGGGVMLQTDSINSDYAHVVGYANSETKIYYLFEQLSPEKIILDILEIDKAILNNEMSLVDGFCTNKSGKGDSEIIAIVQKPMQEVEAYSNIKRAWRANRDTGKFEEVAIKEVGVCYNEGYGSGD